MRRPASICGSAAGNFRFHSTCQREALYRSNSAMRLWSTEFKPSVVLASTGKNATIQAQASTAKGCGR